MEMEFGKPLTDRSHREWTDFLDEAGLKPDDTADFTVMVRDGDVIAATGSMTENILKCIAVNDEYREEGLLGTVMTELRREAFARGYDHLFLYTKPENRLRFEGLLFYEVAGTKDVLLMESERNGVRNFIASAEKPVTCGNIGAIVMNADPFTNGHRFLVERAADESDHVYVFVVSEDKGFFSAQDRLAMVKRGTCDIKNVTVLRTGPYLISQVSFPTYFLKEDSPADEIKCDLDIEIFCKLFAPAFGIKRRFLGTEPISHVTADYNMRLEKELPKEGIETEVIERLADVAGPISAGRVRRCITEKNTDELRNLVPETTLRYLEEKHVF